MMDLMSEFQTSVCDPAIDSGFLSLITTFRIIVLTYNRPQSLLRLLRSIETSDYSFCDNNPNWKLILEIKIDRGGDKVKQDKK